MKYFKKFDQISEKNSIVEKGSLIDIAWNILTLGQEKRIIRSLKNVFGLSSYLIRAKHVKLNRIFSQTNSTMKSRYRQNKRSANKDKDLIRQKIDQQLTRLDLEIDDDLIQTIKNLLVQYEIETRALGFGQEAKNILEHIKSRLLKVEHNPEGARLIISDLKREIQQLHKSVDKESAKKHTAALPAYKLKNLALDTANIINRNEQEDKERLRIVWEKGKNKIFQKYQNNYDIPIVDNWLDLNNYRVSKYDPKLDILFKKLPKTIEKLSSTFRENSFRNITTEDNIQFESHVEYVFKIKNYYIIVWCAGGLEDNTVVLIPVGVFKYRDNKFKPYNSFDIKYSNINQGNNIFYYVPNLKSYMIEKSPKNDNQITLWLHMGYGVDMKMDDEYKINVGQPNKNEVSEKITNMLWPVDHMKLAVLSNENADEIFEIDEKVKHYENLGLDIEQRWSNISTHTLELVGWSAEQDPTTATATIDNAG